MVQVVQVTADQPGLQRVVLAPVHRHQAVVVAQAVELLALRR